MFNRMPGGNDMSAGGAAATLKALTLGWIGG